MFCIAAGSKDIVGKLVLVDTVGDTAAAVVNGNDNIAAAVTSAGRVASLTTVIV